MQQQDFTSKGEDLRIGVTGSISNIKFYTDNDSGYPDPDGNTLTQSLLMKHIQVVMIIRMLQLITEMLELERRVRVPLEVLRKGSSGFIGYFSIQQAIQVFLLLQKEVMAMDI